MLGNNFWGQENCEVVYENSLYVVVVTPMGWRKVGKETDRLLQEYAVVNKQYGTVEASANVLFTAITVAKSFTESYQDMIKEDKPNANIVGFPSKDRTE